MVRRLCFIVHRDWNGSDVDLFHCVHSKCRALEAAGDRDSNQYVHEDDRQCRGGGTLGGLLNSRLAGTIKEAGLADSLGVDSANSLLREESRGDLTTEELRVLQDGLTDGLHLVYIGLLVLAIVSFLLILQLPKKRIEIRHGALIK